MKLSYQKPVVESLVEGKNFRFTSLAQTATLQLCGGGPTVDIVNGQLEFCDDASGGGPAVGDTVEITCSQDGLVHEVTVLGQEPGSISCPAGDLPFLLTVDIAPPFPSTCTATSVVDELGCDSCNIGQEGPSINCSDGIDNDCDGDVDTADVDCG